MVHVDSLYHPRQSTLENGWAMEPTTLEDLNVSFTASTIVEFENIAKASSSSSSSSSNVTFPSSSSASSIQSPRSSESHDGLHTFPSLEVDSGYGSSSEPLKSSTSTPSTPRKLRKKSKSRTRDNATSVPRKSLDDSTAEGKERKRKFSFGKKEKEKDLTSKPKITIDTSSPPQLPPLNINERKRTFSSGKKSTATSSPNKSKASLAAALDLASSSSSSSSSSSPTKEKEKEPRGRKFSLKAITPFGSSKKSTTTPSADAPPMPQLSSSVSSPVVPSAAPLPIAEKFARALSPFAPPPTKEETGTGMEVKELTPELWNNETLIPSSKPKSKPSSSPSSEKVSSPPKPETISSSPIPQILLLEPEQPLTPLTYISSTPSSPFETDVQIQRAQITITQTPKLLSVPSQSPYGPPPPIPEDQPQPKSFLSMSSSTVNLLSNSDSKAKEKRKGRLLALPAALRVGRKDDGGYDPESHFSFIEVNKEDAERSPFTPMSWVELPRKQQQGQEGEGETFIELLTPPSPRSGYLVPSPSDAQATFIPPSPITPSDFRPVPHSNMYTQPIPQIQRGRQHPFPQRPILPTSSVPRLRVAREDTMRYPARYFNLAGVERGVVGGVEVVLDVPEDFTPAELDLGEEHEVTGGLLVPPSRPFASRGAIISMADSEIDGYRPPIDTPTSRAMRVRFEEAVAGMIKDDR